ncbi:MAG: GNAT family N-acetyltransferase [Deltaproteobacteria bacterium]|nr:GNAT family N-acetyltransferase [Deltaproteobacteria bacterium]
MPDAIRTELKLPADARLLSLVQDYVRGLAGLAGLLEEEARSLAQGVWEACQLCIENDFDADDAATYSLTAELTPATLNLSLRDHGLPFDQGTDAAAPQSDAESPEPVSTHGYGLDLINHCADEVRWLNHGLEGNELRLTKYLAGVCRLDAPPARAANHQDAACVLRAPEYTIRLLRPGDGPRVAQLMYRVYGYSYSNEDFYYPDRLDHDLESGRHVGVVAVADTGEIVGHAGIERPDLGPLAELGQLAVAPNHRRHGLRKLMGDRLQEEIGRLGLTGLYGEAVTVHTYSQEASENRNLRACAIKLLDWQAQFKRVDSLHPGLLREAAAQRESMVLYFKYLQPPGPVRVCAPSRHRGIMAKIYANLGISVDFLEPSGPTGFGKVAVHYDKATGVGTIQVNRIGFDTMAECYQGWQDLSKLAGAAVIGLDLPLAQGGTPFLSDLAEENGFFFSGIKPHFAPDGDFLRLQYLNAELYLERLRIYSLFARDLLDYVLLERARVGQPR